MDTIGSRLKAYAKARCGSIKRLAEELEVRPDNLQKYASDRHEPGAKLLLALARHGCNVHWLISGDGQMLVQEGETSEKSVNSLTGIQDLIRRKGMDLETLRNAIDETRDLLDIAEGLLHNVERLGEGQ
jgi:transcriptional regulator with XRE-family HTH domain